MFMIYIDLAELDEVFNGNPFWSVGRFNLAYLRRGDHMGDSGIPLDQAVRELVAERTGRFPTGPIRMLTHLRYFGICFNPITFYYCFDQTDTHIEATVAEVHNTPWLEEHCYVLDPNSDTGESPWRRYHIKKEFHVSPFMEMGMEYDWRLTDPGAQIRVLIRNMQQDMKFFEASMVLNRRPLTPSALTNVMLHYPAMTLKVILAIYWQALKLRLKGAKFQKHPKKIKPSGHEGGPDA